MVKWFENLEDALFTRSRSMGPPWGAVLRVVRYPAALIRDWLRGEISVQAMSLAYTTLLSIVPLMVFSFSILKGLGARGDLQFLLDGRQQRLQHRLIRSGLSSDRGLPCPLRWLRAGRRGIRGGRHPAHRDAETPGLSETPVDERALLAMSCCELLHFGGIADAPTQKTHAMKDVQ